MNRNMDHGLQVGGVERCLYGEGPSFMMNYLRLGSSVSGRLDRGVCGGRGLDRTESDDTPLGT